LTNNFFFPLTFYFKVAFKLFDLNHDGKLKRRELDQVLQECAEENSLDIPLKGIKELRKVLLRNVPNEGKKYITYSDFKRPFLGLKPDDPVSKKKTKLPFLHESYIDPSGSLSSSKPKRNIAANDEGSFGVLSTSRQGRNRFF